MSKPSSSSSGGTGFVGLLTIVFITLKLTGHIDWSWWWVLAPIWISTLIVLAVLLVLGAIYVALERQERKDRKKLSKYFR